MRNTDGDQLRPERRWLLLAFAQILVIACGVLALGFRAVPNVQLAGTVAAVLYVLAANFVLGPREGPNRKPNRVLPLTQDGQLSRVIVRTCIVSSFLLSIALPWAWIVFFSPSFAQRQLLGPHLFMMMVQVLFEIWSYRATISMLIRVTIPVAFVAYRMKLLITWVQQVFLVVSDDTSDLVMRVLAVSNLVFWSVILFYVLLLKVCPPYFLEKKVEDNAHAESN